MADRSGTRDRIQEVALELFAEQGYDKTSLREIAEELGVTKAALYYHFKSKDDIVVSMVQDYLAELDQLLEQAATGERTPETKRELLTAYSQVVRKGSPVMQLFQQNPTGMKNLQIGQEFRERMMRLHAFLREEGDSPKQLIRATVAIFTLHIGMAATAEQIPDPDVRAKASLEVSLEVLGLG